jgi:hypothetical protein
MSVANNGGPAFPRPIGFNGLTNHEEHEVSDAQGGMTLRDYFAAQALTGVVSVLAFARQDIVWPDVAERCYELADAMLAERERAR